MEEKVRAGEGWSGAECVFRAGVAMALLNSAAVIAAQDWACQHALVQRGGVPLPEELRQLAVAGGGRAIFFSV